MIWTRVAGLGFEGKQREAATFRGKGIFGKGIWKESANSEDEVRDKMAD
jgi:hypothetical protein